MKPIQATALLALFALAACAPTPSAQRADACAADDPECLVSLAMTALSVLPVDEDRILPQSEIAIAAFVAGRTNAVATLLEQARQIADGVENPTDRATYLTDIATAYAATGCGAGWSETVEAGLAASSLSREINTAADLNGKLIVVQGRCGDLDNALVAAANLSEASETVGSYKARALQDLAPMVAGARGLADAETLLATMSAGPSYYQAVAYARVAKVALADGKADAVPELLQKADDIARYQQDGYFGAGALREIGSVHVLLGDTQSGEQIFADAVAAARAGQSAQHRARAISQIATDMADVGLYDAAKQLVAEAVREAQREHRDVFRYWAYYDIAGSAAFSGDVDTAELLLGQIPESFDLSGSRLVAAAQRDVAWGAGRHGEARRALALAQGIVTTRERIQALSRLARLHADPAMAALPRNL